MNNLKVSTREMEWGGRKLVLETGKVAKQATGAVVVTYGETKVPPFARPKRQKPIRTFSP